MVSIRYLQKYIQQKDHHPELIKDYYMKLTEEVGELGRAIRMNKRPQTPAQIKETLDEEIWDIIYYALAIANCYEIDLEEVIALKEKVNSQKYQTDIVYDPDSEKI